MPFGMSLTEDMQGWCVHTQTQSANFVFSGSKTKAPLAMAQADALVLAEQRQTWSMKASGSKPISHLVREDLKSAESFYRYKNKKPY